MNDKNYWESYYEKHSTPWKESPFAAFVWEYLEEWKEIIELWCWNARDSLYFYNKWLKVFAVDQCENEINFLNKNYWADNLLFHAWDFTRLEEGKSYNYIYSRFTLHSINLESENRVLEWGFNNLESWGKFFLEARSIKDDLCWEWKKVSNNSYVTDHFRRFLNYEDFILKLEKIWFDIEFKVESNGLAVYKEEDPVVIRVIASKK